MESADLRNAYKPVKAAVRAAVVAMRLSPRFRSRRGLRAFADAERDKLITSLPPFGAARESLRTIPFIREWYGEDNCTRLLLDFVYFYWSESRTGRYNPRVFDRRWASFDEELTKPDWTYQSVAPLTNVVAPNDELQIAEGLMIAPWTENDPFDWPPKGFRISRHAVVASHSSPKRPDNYLLIDTTITDAQILRALTALRLVQSGDVMANRVRHYRPTAFPMGFGGDSSTYASNHFRLIGRPYEISDDNIETIAMVYAQLEAHSTEHRDRFKAMDIALVSFNSMYDRMFDQDAVINACVCLEALLMREQTEMSFRLAFRGSGLLATEDDARIACFDLIRDFYNLRSRVVHGDALDKKQRALLNRSQEFIDLTRRLIMSFLNLETTSEEFFPSPEFYSNLDRYLLHTATRQRLADHAARHRESVIPQTSAME